MLPLFRPWSHRTALQAAESRPRRSHRHRLDLEALEGRQLLSLGPELVGNAFMSGPQQLAVNASADGRSVLVWVDRGLTTSSNEQIEFRLFNSSGVAVTSDIAVQASGGDVTDPAVAMDHNGNFVITWTQHVFGQEDNILAQRFNSVGGAIGGPISVATTTLDESLPDVAMDTNGNFVIAYQQLNSTFDIVAKRYSNTGTFLGTVDTQSGAAFPGFNDLRPSVAMAADGRFAVAYEYYFDGDSANSQIWTITYNANGVLHRGISVAASSSDEQDPDVAMRDNGELTVVYEKLVGNDRDIKARRVGFDGQVFGEINIVNSLNDEFDPTVVMNRNGFSFVVAYDSFGNGGNRVGVVEITNDNVRIQQPDIQGAFNSAISVGLDGEYLVTYQRTAGTDADIFRRRGSGSRL